MVLHDQIKPYMIFVNSKVTKILFNNKKIAFVMISRMKVDFYLNFTINRLSFKKMIVTLYFPEKMRRKSLLLLFYGQI